MTDIYLTSKKLAIMAGGCLIAVIMFAALLLCCNNEQAPVKEPIAYAGAGDQGYQPR